MFNFWRPFSFILSKNRQNKRAISWWGIIARSSGRF